MNPSPTIIVVNNPKDWSIPIPGVRVVSSKSYLLDPFFAELKNARIFNLCRSYQYQTKGYYVSLLATARGHKAFPSVNTLQKMRTNQVIQTMAEDFQDLIERLFKDISSPTFSLSIYFGKNLAKRYDTLALKLFNLFDAPLLRAHFINKKGWELQRITAISDSDIPDSHREFVTEKAIEYFNRRRSLTTRKKVYTYDMAILHDPKEENPPSDKGALRQFINAADSLGINVDLITPEDLSRIGEYDALFLRMVTQVNNIAYRFAAQAEAKGIVVIDDPESIIRCTNKVFLAEALKRNGIDIPLTFIVHKENVETIVEKLSFPIILKQPDSSFSQGVSKVHNEKELSETVEGFLKESELIIAQEYIPSDYDWRIGILDGRPLYACKYHMAKSHWQILKKLKSGKLASGKVEPVAVQNVPKKVMDTALKATNLIGKSLYGVDIKTTKDRCVIIEVNDNPNIDAGYEDAILKKGLYTKMAKSFLSRIELLRGKNR